MCESCGCGDNELVPVEVHASILEGNDRVARHNREHFAEAGVLAVNVMGSPGSGKTALLEATAKMAGSRLRFAAVSGDLATERDAVRLAAAHIPAGTITTGSACHLDAKLVHHALHDLPWQHCEVFFIENVGNLVCPAIYDLGQMANVVVLSVTEGEDKPIKYPVMFRKADLVVISKIDLLPYVDVRLDVLEEGIASVMPSARSIRVSSRTGEGIAAWVEWLESRRPVQRLAASAG